MADTKISALTALTGANVDAAADYLAIVDTSVTTTKKILVSELFKGQTTTTAFENATTLLTIGGTGATAVFAIPGTLEWSGTTGALTVAGGAYVAKKLKVVGAVDFDSTLLVTGALSLIAIPNIKGAAQSAMDFLAAAGGTTGYRVGRSVGGADAHNFFIYDLTNSATRLAISSTGVLTVANLAGAGTRAVVVDANGVMSAP